MIHAIVFFTVYGGIAIGRYPGLAIDRTGIALLGALAMLLFGCLTPAEALDAVNFPTLLLLYGLMIISAQLRLGGFYTRLAVHTARWIGRPRVFLLLMMLVSGTLAAVLANDIICLAFTPPLTVALRRRGLNPLPYLLGLAMATNLGSATTIIGNPQSMLIGQMGDLDFVSFFLWCLPPSLLCLLLTYGVLALLFRSRFRETGAEPVISEPTWPDFNRWQSFKGLAAAGVVVLLLAFGFPRALSTLAVAGFLLLSRRMHTRAVLGLIDWHLITMFCGLFVVVRGFQASGIPTLFLDRLAASGWDFTNPRLLAVVALILSNLVSNVPATVLMGPFLPTDNPTLWYTLSLSTTYAGNLLIIGSMANLIVIEQAKQLGVRITFANYARVGIVVTLVNFAVLFAWIRLVGG